MNPNPFLQSYTNPDHASVGAYTFYYIRFIQLLHFIYVDRLNCDDLKVEYNHLDPQEITAWLLQDYQHTMDNGSAADIVEKIIELFFHPSTEAGKVQPYFIPHMPEPYLFTDREVLALYLLIHDERVFPFLSQSVRDKLKTAMEQHPFHHTFETILENYQSTRPATQIDAHTLEITHTLFRTIIEESHTVEIATTDGNHMVTPCHLRYFANTEDYHLLGLLNESKYIYVPVKDIQSVCLREDKPVSNRYTILTELLEQDALTLKLRVTNDKNALERAYHLFADYTKETTLVETILDDEDELQDHTYHLNITYYPFDEDDIYQNILALSAMVTVLEPISIRDRVLQHFTTFLERWG